MPRLAITGIGAVTSVGYRAVTSAAAIRAGISRPAPLAVSYPDPTGVDDVPLVGHRIAGVTDGFEGVALQNLLASRAVRDLVTAAQVDGNGPLWASAALHVCASPYRSEDLSFMTERMREALTPRLVASARVPVEPANQLLVLEAHAGVLLSLTAASRAIEERRVARVLVVGVDSLVKEVDLEWLQSRGRLKTPDDPTGLEPGEGAAAILVESEDEARRRKAKVLAWLDSVQVGQEAQTRAEGHRGTGRALADAIRGAMGSRRDVGLVFADLDGTSDRAWEWGMAVSRLASTIDLPAAPETIASSIGDTGAASGALQLVCAVQALVRGYARGDACLVCSSADSGKVGAALLTAAGPPVAMWR